MTSQTQLLLPDGRTFEVHASCTLGRTAVNTVAIANDHISRKHALIQVQGDGECWIVDLGSSNGTYVNGRRISRPLALKNGDVIDMAGSQITYQSKSLVASPDDTSAIGSTLRDIKKKNCWLMVADIVDSTRMTRDLPPEEVPQITGGWFNACRELIEDQGGNMNQYLGDGFFCYWENTFDAKSRVLDALRQLTHMQEQNNPRFRVVLHFGETVLSNVPNTGELNLHGHEVHFVFRMEKIAGHWQDRLLCSEAAWRALGVKSLTHRESPVSGYDGIFQFHVPDLRG